VSDFRDTLAVWIDQRLDHILEAPPMWGSPEAVELQVLQLVQVRALAQRAPPALESPGRVFDAYLSYLSQRFPKQPQRPLFELVGQDDEAYSKLAAGLRGFIEMILPVMQEGDSEPVEPSRPRPHHPLPSLASSERHDWLDAA
jgi:hypothetical protein